MKLISHRGNINGINPDRENSPEYILEAISLGYDVEIDIRTKDNKLYLGHDYCQYETNLLWLKKYSENLWIHTKDFDSLNFLMNQNLKIFYHQKESHTIIHNTSLIWSHNLEEISENSIIPLLDFDSINKFDKKIVFGVCSDFIKILK